MYFDKRDLGHVTFEKIEHGTNIFVRDDGMSITVPCYVFNILFIIIHTVKTYRRIERYRNSSERQYAPVRMKKFLGCWKDKNHSITFLYPKSLEKSGYMKGNVVKFFISPRLFYLCSMKKVKDFLAWGCLFSIPKDFCKSL